MPALYEGHLTMFHYLTSNARDYLPIQVNYSGTSDSGPSEIGTQYNTVDLSIKDTGQGPNNLFSYISNTF